MLVVTRKKNECLIIGDDIRVHVLEFGNDFVKLGIQAPHHVPVHREEVYRKIREANLAAASSQIPPVAPSLVRTAIGAEPGEAALAVRLDKEE